MKTERLYYADCYLSDFEASVVDIADNGCRVYLDRTAFYPTSGGQPHDLGVLNGSPILDIVDGDDRVAHILAVPLQDKQVRGQIDWPRRYDHMQQHTGQHLLSAVLVERFGYQTLSFHMGQEISTIELDTKELSDEKIQEAEQLSNAIVGEARPVQIEFEESESAEGLRKPSERSGTLRIVRIHGLDRSACGGTHVRSTAETGPILIRRKEKIRGNTRIEFVCGGRAIARAKQDFHVALELARQNGVAIDSLPQHVAALRERLTEAEKQRQQLAVEIARREGEAMYDATSTSTDGMRRVLLRVNAIDDAVRAKAQAFVRKGSAVALVLGIEPSGVVIACSSDSGVDAGAILKEHSPRGGGSPTLAQGSLPDEIVGERLKGALGFELAGEVGDSD